MRFGTYLSFLFHQFTHPENLAEELIGACGPYLHTPTNQGYVLRGVYDLQTFYEESRQQTEWYAKAAVYVMKKYAWVLFIMKWHGPDYLQHACLNMIDPLHPLHDPSRAEEGWEFFAKYYEPGDMLIATILEGLTEDAALAVVSDHGQVVNYYACPFNRVFEKEGLLERKPEVVQGGIDLVLDVPSISFPQGPFG